MRKAQVIFRLMLVFLFLVGQVSSVSGQETDSPDRFTEIDTSAFSEENSTEEKTVSEEEPTEPEEGEKEARKIEKAMIQAKYDSLLRNAAHVRYDTVRNQVAVSYNATGWKTETSDFDFTEYPPKKKDNKQKNEKPSREPVSSPEWNLGLPMFLVKYGALIILIGVMVWLISMVVKQYISQPNVSKDDLLSWEVNPDKISYTKLEELLETYLREKNHRQALRILFLMVLKDLNTMELIIWRKNKTNRDYLYELKDSGIQLPYRKISIAFDAARYGNYTVTETAFSIIKGYFDAIQKSIKPTIPAK